MFVHTGDYVEYTTDDISRSTYYTFTPRPLMEGNFYIMDDALAALLTETHRTLGILEGMLHSLPDKELFADLMLLRESCFSKLIDYTNFDMHSAMIIRGLSNADNGIKSIASAYRYAMDSDIRKINHNDIIQYALYGSNSKQWIRPRTEPLFLTRTTANYRQYNPTAPRDIHSALNDINKYMKSNTSDPLIKAAMCHYQFEMVHPYKQYNGITGRILAYAILNSAKLTEVRYLNLSECLFHRKTEYFEMMGLAQKSGKYSVWIDFFISAICEAARNSIEFAKTYEKNTRCNEDKLIALHDRAHHTEAVYRYFKKNVAATVTEASSQLHLSFNVASRAVETLQGLGILTQISEGSRNRLFAHAELMRLLSPK